ncbi:hypothetical protein KIPB_014658 [Kipferlia bialata]|uniref:Uncharacterized protein n=1 Tax=Kipferlia bialata TaxID=797122 RepID=A0A391P311_9EUKA|nr:hypothetical protein KIPB_014658 [Kipferlia bialata]|eukprot:g14658.t1
MTVRWTKGLFRRNSLDDPFYWALKGALAVFFTLVIDTYVTGNEDHTSSIIAGIGSFMRDSSGLLDDIFTIPM